MVSVDLGDTFFLGKLCIEISFEVVIGYEAKGCFISLCEEVQMISTHFEPAFARRALPCFDEPCFKSEFTLTVVVDRGWTVISNMSVRNHEIKDSRSAFVFESTPLMSCYLLHWTICKHDKISTFLDNTEVSLYAPHAESFTEALETAKEALAFFNTYLGVPYPLPKLDLISVFSN